MNSPCHSKWPRYGVKFPPCLYHAQLFRGCGSVLGTDRNSVTHPINPTVCIPSLQPWYPTGYHQSLPSHSLAPTTATSHPTDAHPSWHPSPASFPANSITLLFSCAAPFQQPTSPCVYNLFAYPPLLPRITIGSVRTTCGIS